MIFALLKGGPVSNRIVMVLSYKLMKLDMTQTLLMGPVMFLSLSEIRPEIHQRDLQRMRTVMWLPTFTSFLSNN